MITIDRSRMPRQKLNRYARISIDPWVVKWYENLHELFVDERKQHTKIMLELACGRAEYTVWLAPLSPDSLFVGIDSKWDRIDVWLTKIRELWLENVRFVCGIVHHLASWFPSESIDEIWIVHPDPRPKWRDEKRRLTHQRFLRMYFALLKKWWQVKLKTDSQELFAYSVQEFVKFSLDWESHWSEAWNNLWNSDWGAGWKIGWKQLAATTDLYSDEKLLRDHHGIQTHYEKLALADGKTICYGLREKM